MESTTTQAPDPVEPSEQAAPLLHLKTWKEAREYIASRLKPIRFSPNGRPIYDGEEIKALNILLPDEK